MASVCVFCGSRSGDRPEYATLARELGEFLAANGHTLVYGGGSTGIMGAIADAMLKSSGHIIGVIPTHLARVELMHPAVTDMRITVDMHERKATMHRISDAYITLPGGFGTMEEFFEAVTWAQLDLHQRPIAIVNVHGIFDGLIQLMDAMMSSGFLSAKCRSLVTVVDNMDTLRAWLEGRVSATTIP